MAVFSQAKISFSGSFQCRLATDRDPPNVSRNDPFGDMGLPKSDGWTFAYGEPSFDRIIRFSNPVALRSGLIEPFVPVKITRIEVQPKPFFVGVELPFEVVPVDPLLGLSVTLGDNVFFDTAAGGSAGLAGADGTEVLLNSDIAIGAIGGDHVRLNPVTSPQLAGVSRVPEWEDEYRLKKPLVLAPLLGFMQATRRKVLTHNPFPPAILPVFIETYARRFSLVSDIHPLPVNPDFSLIGITGILASMLIGWSWTLNMTFSRFDGDTLVGQVEGTLWGTHSFL